ncbi:MAG TPA: glucuronate isomerase [Clostridiales bacterium]|nr:glucuronate isomerase [Clostridiales bacterium]
MIGSMVDGGLYPCDMEFLKQVVRDICYNNAAAYFGI